MRLTEFLIRNKASVWIAFLVLIVSATMMHPTLASLIAIVIDGGLLILLRRVAHIEGAVYISQRQ